LQAIAPPLDYWVGRDWNSGNEVPREKWLVDVLPQEVKSRLHCLGNIVVPAQASMGAAILSNILKQLEVS